MSKRDWLWVMAGVFFFALVNYPLVQIFNTGRLVGGISPLVWYFFGIWVGAIVVLFLFTQRKTLS